MKSDIKGWGGVGGQNVKNYSWHGSYFWFADFALEFSGEESGDGGALYD